MSYTATELPIFQQLANTTSWQDKYRLIMQSGRLLPPLPAQLKTDEALVKGCDSQVWLYQSFADNEQTMVIMADSDTRIVKGLLYLVVCVFNEKTPTQIMEIDIQSEFENLGLIRHLSPTRGNGLNAIIQQIQVNAQAAI